ncbi:MAG: glycerol-3-phosphate 1-O-acyltransferase PlsY [Rickettsiales bacterium]|nr:glycerol-3-phosphate 1-O-acyltransferase PlsY [Rickettsiales bacterium]
MGLFTLYLFAIVFLPAYLCGSIPFGLIITKLVGNIDIRTQGSGSIGATNTTRALGKKYGALVLFLDGMKAFIPVMLAKHYFPNGLVIPTFIALFVIMGHCFPIWLKFKGGKGISSLIFSLLAINLKMGILFLLIWYIIYKSTKIVSLASLFATLIVNIVTCFILKPVSVPLSFITLVVFFKHRDNIKRIMKGEEMGFKK